MTDGEVEGVLPFPPSLPFDPASASLRNSPLRCALPIRQSDDSLPRDPAEALL
eukprot:gene9525-8443_t